MKMITLSLMAIVLTVSVNAAEPARPWSEAIPVGTNCLVRSLAFSPNNELLAVGCDKGVVKVFDDGCPDRLPTHVLEADSYETKVAISGDGKKLVVTGCPGGVSLFDLGSHKKIKAFSLLVFGSFGLSVDGRQMWADDKIYDLTGDIKKMESPKAVREFPKSSVLYMNCDGSHEMTVVATLNSIQVRNGAGDKLVREIDPGLTKFTVRSLSPDANWLVLESLDPAKPGLHIWDLASGKQTATLAVDGTCHDARITPDGSRFVTVTGKYTVRVWEIATGKAVATLATAEHYWPVAVSPGGTVAYTKDGQQVEFWHPTSN
jgi:WD40 repeat protein